MLTSTQQRVCGTREEVSRDISFREICDRDCYARVKSDVGTATCQRLWSKAKPKLFALHKLADNTLAVSRKPFGSQRKRPLPGYVVTEIPADIATLVGPEELAHISRFQTISDGWSNGVEHDRGIGVIGSPTEDPVAPPP